MVKYLKLIKYEFIKLKWRLTQKGISIYGYRNIKKKIGKPRKYSNCK